MARFRNSHLLLFFILLASVFSCFEGRKLHLGAAHKHGNKVDPSLFFTSLPKGTVPSSAPSKKTHATVVDEKLIARNLISTERVLRSVPSPGAGH